VYTHDNVQLLLQIILDFSLVVFSEVYRDDNVSYSTHAHMLGDEVVVDVVDGEA